METPNVSWVAELSREVFWSWARRSQQIEAQRAPSHLTPDKWCFFFFCISLMQYSGMCLHEKFFTVYLKSRFLWCPIFDLATLPGVGGGGSQGDNLVWLVLAMGTGRYTFLFMTCSLEHMG